MATEKTREIREWLTFGLSLVTAVAIPVGLIVLRNQRLEILKDVADKYVPMATYKEDVAANARATGEIKGKLDSMFIEQIHMSDNFTAFKDRIDSRKP